MDIHEFNRNRQGLPRDFYVPREVAELAEAWHQYQLEQKTKSETDDSCPRCSNCDVERDLMSPGADPHTGITSYHCTCLDCGTKWREEQKSIITLRKIVQSF